MRRIYDVIATITLIAGTAATSTAQIITVYDTSGTRAGLKVAYGGHGIDWETSISAWKAQESGGPSVQSSNSISPAPVTARVHSVARKLLPTGRIGIAPRRSF